MNQISHFSTLPRTRARTPLMARFHFCPLSVPIFFHQLPSIKRYFPRGHPSGPGEALHLPGKPLTMPARVPFSGSGKDEPVVLPFSTRSEIF